MNADNKYKVEYNNGSVILSDISNFSLRDTLDCGQAFRWYEHNGKWFGTAHRKRIFLFESGDKIIIKGITSDEFDRTWIEYFDLSRNYGEIIDSISSDKVLKEVSSFASGIRILKQDPWEALCSFIISQNNNIPRIKGIIERLCENFGEKADDSTGETDLPPLASLAYSFPSAEAIAKLDVEELAPLRSGFRAKYIIDAAQKVANGSVDLSVLDSAPIEDAMNAMMSIKGVGPKVACCALLYGCGRIECFPIDVWMRRAMTKLFDGELPAVAVPYAGIVQQYIFHYARMTRLKIEED